MRPGHVSGVLYQGSLHVEVGGADNKLAILSCFWSGPTVLNSWHQ